MGVHPPPLINLDSPLYRATQHKPVVEVDVDPMVVASAFADPPASAAPSTDSQAGAHGHRFVYLTGHQDPWCQARTGAWWPRQGLWVDRAELEPGDVPPPGARTFALVPGPDAVLGFVHGQITGELAHILVTTPTGEVLAQTTIQYAGPRDLALATLATLIAAAGSGPATIERLLEAAVPGVVDDLASKAWDATGWTTEALDLPGRVVRALGL
jgi:hypothetical protein